MKEFPLFSKFPEGETTSLGDSTLTGPRFDGSGVLVSQSAGTYEVISLDIFLGETPQDGSVRVTLDAAGARTVADHLYRLAGFAEKGIAAK